MKPYVQMDAKMNAKPDNRRKKPQNAKLAWKGLWQELLKVKKAVFIIILFSVCTAFIGTYAPWLSGEITDLLYDGIVIGDGIDFKVFYRSLITLALLYIATYLINYFRRVFTVTAIQEIAISLRMRLGRKINRLPMSYFDKTHKGDILSRITNDIDTINSSLQHCLTSLINATLMMLMIAFTLFRLNVILAILIVFIMPVSLLLSRNLLKISQRLARGRQAAMGDLNAHIEETYSANIIIKSFGGKETVSADFNAKNNELRQVSRRADILSGFFRPITNLVSDLVFVAVCVLSGIFILQGKLSLGNMQTITQYARRFAHPVSEVASFANTIQSTLAAYERVNNFLNEAEQPADCADAIDPEHVKGEIEFRNVTFDYEGTPVLNNVSFSIKPGQKVALVGNTGSGKTTLMKLLLRFYDPQQGEILIDGVSNKKYKQKRLHKIFGVVMQDIWLSDSMIKENIAYAEMNYDMEDVKAAAKSAHAHRFISLLPEGYDHEVKNGGEEFSHGQRQLLTIARAIFRKPEVLLLDEATSSVDARTELLIQRIMDKFMKGRTSLVIAHRLSTIRSSDLILVMQDGKIVEQGNHEELLAKEGYYYQLHESQFADCL